MPNEIKTFDFEDHNLTFERRGDEWYANGNEAAEALGYADKRSVADLYRRHAKEFIDGETCVVTLPPQAVGGKLPPRGQARSVRVYSPRGLEHLAILGRTETCIRFRRWILDVAESLRSGARLVDEQRLAALETALASVLEDRKADRKLIEQLGAITAASIGHAGKMLSTFARSPEAKAYRDAKIREQRERKALERKLRDLPLLDGQN